MLNWQINHEIQDWLIKARNHHELVAVLSPPSKSNHPRPVPEESIGGIAPRSPFWLVSLCVLPVWGCLYQQEMENRRKGSRDFLPGMLALQCAMYGGRRFYPQTGILWGGAAKVPVPTGLWEKPFIHLRSITLWAGTGPYVARHCTLSSCISFSIYIPILH